MSPFYNFDQELVHSPIEKDSIESHSDRDARPVEMTTSSALSEGLFSSASNLSVDPAKSSKSSGGGGGGGGGGGRIGFLRVPFRKLFRKPRSLQSFTEKSTKNSKADPSVSSRAEDDSVSTGTYELDNSNVLAVSQNRTLDRFAEMANKKKPPKSRNRDRQNFAQKTLVPVVVSSSSTTPTISEKPSRTFSLLPKKADLRNVQRSIKQLTKKISDENVRIESMHRKPTPATGAMDNQSPRRQTRGGLGKEEEINENQDSSVLHYAAKQEQQSLEAAPTQLPHSSDFATPKTVQKLNPRSVKAPGLNEPAAPQEEPRYSRVMMERRFPLATSSAAFCDPGIRTNGSYDIRYGHGQVEPETTSQRTALQVLQDLKRYVQNLTADVQKFKQEQMSFVEPPMVQNLEGLNVGDNLYLMNDASLQAGQEPEQVTEVSFDKTSNKYQESLVRTLKELKAQLRSLHANLDSISRSPEESDCHLPQLETGFEAALLHTLADLRTRLKEIVCGTSRRHRRVLSLDSSSQTEVSSSKTMAGAPTELEEIKRLNEEFMRSYSDHSGFTGPQKESMLRITRKKPKEIHLISIGVQYADPRRSQCNQKNIRLPGEEIDSDSKIENNAACSPFEDPSGFETNTNQSAKFSDQSIQVVATPDPLLLKTMEEIRMHLTFICDELLKRNFQGCACTAKSEASGALTSTSGTDPFLLEILEEIKESVQGAQKEQLTDARQPGVPNLTEVMTALSEIRSTLVTLQNEQKQVRPSAVKQNDRPPQPITNMGDMPSRGRRPKCATTWECSSFSPSERDVEDDEFDSGNLTDESLTEAYTNQSISTTAWNDKMGDRTHAQSSSKPTDTAAREQTARPRKSAVPRTSGKAGKKLARLLDLLDECEDVNVPSSKPPKPHPATSNRRNSRERSGTRFTATPAASPVLPQPSFPPFVTFPTPFPAFTPMGYFRPPPPPLMLPPVQQFQPVAPMPLAQRWYPPLPQTQLAPQPQPSQPTYVTGPAPTDEMPKSFTLSFTDKSGDRTSTTISGRKFLCTQMME